MDDASEFIQRDRSIHPPAFTPEYKTTVLRSPRLALWSLQNSLSEVTGPVFGHHDVGPLANDLIHNRTLLADRQQRGAEVVCGFDIHLQRDRETVFFDL